MTITTGRNVINFSAINILESLMHQEKRVKEDLLSLESMQFVKKVNVQGNSIELSTVSGFV